MHDAEASQKRSTDTNDVGNDDQTPAPVDVTLEILRDIPQAQEFGQALFHKHNLSVIGGYRRSAAQRNGDVGFFQSNGVVDTVANEADGSPFLLQKLDVFGLILRQNFRKIAVHTQLFGEIASRAVVIARNDGQMLGAPFTQSVDDVQRFGPIRSAHFDGASQGAIDRHQDERISLVVDVLHLLIQRTWEQNVFVLHESRAADSDCMAVN